MNGVKLILIFLIMTFIVSSSYAVQYVYTNMNLTDNNLTEVNYMYANRYFYQNGTELLSGSGSSGGINYTAGSNITIVSSIISWSSSWVSSIFQTKVDSAINASSLLSTIATWFTNNNSYTSTTYLSKSDNALNHTGLLTKVDNALNHTSTLSTVTTWFTNNNSYISSTYLSKVDNALNHTLLLSKVDNALNHTSTIALVRTDINNNRSAIIALFSTNDTNLLSKINGINTTANIVSLGFVPSSNVTLWFTTNNTYNSNTYLSKSDNALNKSTMISAFSLNDTYLLSLISNETTNRVNNDSAFNISGKQNNISAQSCTGTDKFNAFSNGIFTCTPDAQGSGGGVGTFAVYGSWIKANTSVTGGIDDLEINDFNVTGTITGNGIQGFQLKSSTASNLSDMQTKVNTALNLSGLLSKSDNAQNHSLYIKNNTNVVFVDANITGNLTIYNNKGDGVTLNNFVEHTQELMTDTLLDKSRSTLSCTGGQLNYTLVAFYGCYQFNFNGTLHPSTGSACLNNATVTLTCGTNTTPVTNYVYWELVANVPTMKVSSTYPTTDHIDVATWKVGNCSGTSYNIYAYSRNRYEVDTFVKRILERFEDAGTLYKSGLVPSANTTNLNITAGGEYFNGIFEMTTANSLRLIDGFYYINSSGNFVQANSLASFTQYIDGTAFSGADERVNIVWGLVATTTTAGGVTPTTVKLVAVLPNLPVTKYTTLASAIADAYDSTNYFPSDSVIKNTFVPIARTILRPNSDVFEQFTSGLYYQDIRGKITSGGGSSARVDTSGFLTKDDNALNHTSTLSTVSTWFTTNNTYNLLTYAKNTDITNNNTYYISNYAKHTNIANNNTFNLGYFAKNSDMLNNNTFNIKNYATNTNLINNQTLIKGWIDSNQSVNLRNNTIMQINKTCWDGSSCTVYTYWNGSCLLQVTPTTQDKQGSSC